MLEALNDPSRVANCDESGIEHNPSPRTKTVTLTNSQKSRSNTFGKEKQSTTIMLTLVADGSVLKTLIYYPYKKNIPQDIRDKVDKDLFNVVGGTGYSRQETFAYFLEYVSNLNFKLANL